MDALYRAGRLVEMGVMLPGLLRDADALVAASVDGTLEAARAARSRVRLAAASNGDFMPVHTPWHLVGPTMVALAQAENAMVIDRPDTALAIGAHLERRGVAGQYVRHRLDVANAHAALRQFPEAMQVLVQLREAAPEWLACQRYASDILGKIIRRRRMLSAEMREMADFMHLAI